MMLDNDYQHTNVICLALNGPPLPSKSNFFFVFVVNLKIMTAVTSQQCLPEMIKDIPPGHAKDMVFRLCGHTGRSLHV